MTHSPLFRKTAIALAITSTLATNSAYATRSDTQQSLLEGGTFTTLTVAGAVAGGPLGMIAGSIVGAFLADQTRTANGAEAVKQNAELALKDLKQEIAQHEQEIAKLEKYAIDKLVFQIMFPTAEDSLGEADIDRVQVLATYLNDNPELVINLDGHADPRGTDEFNNVLAQERAISVKNSLIFYGVEEHRISTHGHGSHFSNADRGDLDGYAQDRRVDIEISNTDKDIPVASGY